MGDIAQPWPERPDYELTREMIEEAARALAPYDLTTPLVPSRSLSQRLGRPVFLKCENQQRTGSFKLRGALVRLSRLAGVERHRGVVAASAGNHGLGVAWACRQLGIPGLVVLPENAPKVKRAGLQEMLIKVRLHGHGYDEAEAHARLLAEEAGATFVSPFDDPWVMAGNGGTMGLEIRSQLPDVSAVLAPVGGGGLAAGLAVALAGVPVLGVNTAASPAMARSLAERRVYRSFAAGPTIAEGLEGGVSPSSAWHCARHVHGLVVVEERSLAEAVCHAARHEKQVIEGSAAAGIAALLEGVTVPGSGPVCLVLTGRNIDSELLRHLLKR
jgi:threonine dehydratase